MLGFRETLHGDPFESWMSILEHLNAARARRRYFLMPKGKAWFFALAGHAALGFGVWLSEGTTPGRARIEVLTWSPREEVLAPPPEEREPQEAREEPEAPAPVPDPLASIEEPEIPDPPPEEPEPVPIEAPEEPLRSPALLARLFPRKDPPRSETPPPPRNTAAPRARVDPSPIPGENPPPEYPEAARAHAWSGTVLLLVRVGADGKVLSVEILKSSGYPVLDREARKTIATWRFRNGPGKVEIPVEFRFRRS